MELLYSNILPLALEDGQASIIDSFHEQIALSDRIKIAVGYVSKAALEELDSLVYIYRLVVVQYSSFRRCWKQMVWRQEKTISLKDGMMPRKMQLSFRLKKMNKVPSRLKSVQLDITSIWT